MPDPTNYFQAILQCLGIWIDEVRLIPPYHKRVKQFIVILAIGLTVGGIYLINGEAFTRVWERFLVVSVPMEKADALIVLGGEPLARPLEAARLFHQGVAAKVFITGIGDAASNRQVLIEAGVPSEAITVEKKSRTTYSNATLLKPLLERSQVRSALIVTSPFHTRRALTTFRKVIPDVSFGVVQASIGWWKTPQGLGDVNRFALVEFLKTAEYWLLHGVSPFLSYVKKADAK